MRQLTLEQLKQEIAGRDVSITDFDNHDKTYHDDNMVINHKYSVFVNLPTVHQEGFMLEYREHWFDFELIA